MRSRDILDVWHAGTHAGALMRSEQGSVEFIYDDDYRATPSNTPLSLSMPKTRAGHAPDVVMPWLSNLLPDAEEVRDRWAAKFGEHRNDPFTLLKRPGFRGGSVIWNRPLSEPVLQRS